MRIEVTIRKAEEALRGALSPPQQWLSNSFNGTIFLPGVEEKSQRTEPPVKIFFCAYPVANGWFWRASTGF